MRLNGKVALVTGAVGIRGRTIDIRLAREGAYVVVTDHPLNPKGRVLPSFAPYSHSAAHGARRYSTTSPGPTQTASWRARTIASRPSNAGATATATGITCDSRSSSAIGCWWQARRRRIWRARTEARRVLWGLGSSRPGSYVQRPDRAQLTGLEAEAVLIDNPSPAMISYGSGRFPIPGAETPAVGQ